MKVFSADVPPGDADALIGSIALNKANEERPLLRRLAKVARGRQLFGCNEKLSREM